MGGLLLPGIEEGVVTEEAGDGVEGENEGLGAGAPGVSGTTGGNWS